MNEKKAASQISCQILNVKYCGKLKLYIQGVGMNHKVCFLTVHDIGFNHDSFCDYVQSPPMTEMAKKSVWIHVTLPGLDDFEETLPENYEYPSMSEIASDLLNIVDYFEIETVIGFGEGAGANILMRFGLMHPNRCLGLVLINCTGGTATLDERMQSTMLNVEKGRQQLMTKAMKMFQSNKVAEKEKEKFFTENHLNPINVSKYFQSYLKRDDISKWLSTDLKVDCFVVTAKYSSQKILCQEMVKHMDKLRTTLLVIDDVGDVLYDAQKDLTRSLILFCKGCGVLLSVPLLGLEKEFKRVHEKHEMNEAELKLSRQIQMYESLLKADL